MQLNHIDISDVSARQKYAIWRKLHNISLEKVSQAIGVSISTISRWENGKREFPEHILVKYNEYIDSIEKRQSKQYERG